jgi:hypothetical protein
MARIPKNLDSRKNNVSFEIVTLTNFKYYDDIHNRIKAIQSNSIRQEALSCGSDVSNVISDLNFPKARRCIECATPTGAE